MQTLYTLLATHSEDKEKAPAAGQRILNDKLNQSLDLFTTIVTYLASVAQYAETDSRVRASKYLPTEADKNVNTKIAGNEMIWQTLDNETYREKLKQGNIAERIDQDQVKKLYQMLVQTSEYESYIADQQRSAKAEKAIVRFIWTELMVKNEDFQGFLMDEVAGWEDDKDMIFILMDQFFKNHQSINYLALISGEKLEFARELLSTSISKEEYCMELIRPKLINWEAERVAQIDLILLRLGICELLYFPTIPTKVTINEYIEIAKQYSTPQSGHFVNAVLDKLLKDFEMEKQIRKQDRPAR